MASSIQKPLTPETSPDTRDTSLADSPEEGRIALRPDLAASPRGLRTVSTGISVLAAAAKATIAQISLKKKGNLDLSGHNEITVHVETPEIAVVAKAIQSFAGDVSRH